MRPVTVLANVPVTSRPWVMPPKLLVSAETRRMLMELAEDDDDEPFEAVPVADLAEFRDRRGA